MLKNHFTTTNITSNSGKDYQWMLQLLGKNVPRNRIVTWSQSIPSPNPFTCPKHLLQGKQDILAQQKDVVTTTLIRWSISSLAFGWTNILCLPIRYTKESTNNPYSAPAKSKSLNLVRNKQTNSDSGTLYKDLDSPPPPKKKKSSQGQKCMNVID